MNITSRISTYVSSSALCSVRYKYIVDPQRPIEKCFGVRLIGKIVDVNKKSMKKNEHQSSQTNESSDHKLQSRRDLVRHGVKLAFVAPVISTFFACDVYAANYSCYPTGHACTGPSGTDPEDCCSGTCSALTCT